jgi:polyisoprenoid-binding protein YceI
MKLTLTTTLNRRDFGLMWNTWIVSVGGELAVNLAIEATPAR